MGKGKSNIVKIGTQIELELIYRSDHKELLTIDLVPDSQSDIENGYLGISTPLAKTILGEIPGITVPYFTTELQAVKILDIQKTTRYPDTSISSRRGKTIQNTLDEIEFRNAILFASSTDTKWGSYDAEGVDFNKWKSDENSNDEDQ
jgi:hypothetical protein